MSPDVTEHASTFGPIWNAIDHHRADAYLIELVRRHHIEEVTLLYPRESTVEIYGFRVQGFTIEELSVDCTHLENAQARFPR